MEKESSYRDSVRLCGFFGDDIASDLMLRIRRYYPGAYPQLPPCRHGACGSTVAESVEELDT